PTAVIILFVTTTTALLIGAAPVPSISRAAFSTTTPLPTGGSGMIRVCAATSEWTSNNATQTNLNFFKVIPLKLELKKRRGIVATKGHKSTNNLANHFVPFVAKTTRIEAR